MAINNITTYKKAKVITKDLLDVLAIIDQTEKKLAPYSKYLPILNCLSHIADAKLILVAHYKKQEKILKNKGAE